MVWYFHLFQNCPQFIVIHTVKGFGIVSKAEIDVFLGLSCFFDDPVDVGNWISGSSAFSKSSLNSSCILEAWLGEFWAFLCQCVRWVQLCGSLSILGIGMKTDLFQSCGHCWVFHICWHIECSTFTPSSLRIWNSSTGIPSPPLALFIVMLSKAHLTSYSRMSGSRWVITPSWFSWSWRSFLYSSSVYSCHLFLISCASFGLYHFCPLLSPALHEMFPWYL